MSSRRREQPRVLYERLDTTFVSLPALLRFLQQRDFTGRVHVELDEYDGDIYLAARQPFEARERDINVSSPESFTAHFRAAREELADDYPFLTSLANCVEYVEGEPRLNRQTDISAFVEGVCATLRRVVARVAARDAEGRGVRREVARELAALGERRPKALARFGFAAELERIAGLRWT